MTLDPTLLAPLLAFAGLVIGAAAYFVLIRRRRHDALANAEEERAASHRRAMARFRRIQRRDQEEPEAGRERLR